jgi:hypothetical protein
MREGLEAVGPGPAGADGIPVIAEHGVGRLV